MISWSCVWVRMSLPPTPACPCLLYLLHKGAMEIAMPGATGPLSFFSLSPSLQRGSLFYLLSSPRPIDPQHGRGLYSIIGSPAVLPVTGQHAVGPVVGNGMALGD